MSYSTYMYIYGCKNGIDGDLKVDKTCQMFDTNFDIIPDNGYWSKTNEDYVTFTEFMKNKIMSERQKENNEPVFIFCNHDGETDEEVYQSFVEFAKILAYMNPQIRIEIETQAFVKHKCINIISKRYGNLKIQIEDVIQNQNELKTEVQEYERIVDIKWHEEQLEKLRTCNMPEV